MQPHTVAKQILCYSNCFLKKFRIILAISLRFAKFNVIFQNLKYCASFEH